MRQECPVRVPCPPDVALSNYSSELPDFIEYWSWIWPNEDPYEPPCIGADCIPGPTQCTEDVQMMFDAMASMYSYNPKSTRYAALEAAAREVGCTLPPLDPEDDEEELEEFFNAEKCASSFCPDGTMFTYCVPAGVKRSGLIPKSLGPAWQAWADAWAESYAFNMAQASKICIEPPQPPSIPPFTPPGETPPGGGAPVPGGKIPENPARPSILGDGAWVCLNKPISPSLCEYQVKGGHGMAYIFNASGLPPGIQLKQTTGTKAHLEGTPTKAGNYKFTISITNESGPLVHASREDEFHVFGITNCPKKLTAMKNADFSYLLTAEGGTKPYQWYLDPEGGSLPDGIDLNQTTGAIHGKPKATATSSSGVRIIVADSGGSGKRMVCDCVFDFDITGPVPTGILPVGQECSIYPGVQLGSIPPGCTFSGNLPYGLILTTAGEILPTCVKYGGGESSKVTINVKDPVTGATGSKDFTLYINSNPAVVLGRYLAVKDIQWNATKADAGYGITSGLSHVGGNIHISGSAYRPIGTPAAPAQMGATLRPQNALFSCLCAGAYPLTLNVNWTLTVKPGKPPSEIYCHIYAIIGAASFNQDVKASGSASVTLQPYQWTDGSYIDPYSIIIGIVFNPALEQNEQASFSFQAQLTPYVPP